MRPIQPGRLTANPLPRDLRADLQEPRGPFAADGDEGHSTSLRRGRCRLFRAVLEAPRANPEAAAHDCE